MSQSSSVGKCVNRKEISMDNSSNVNSVRTMRLFHTESIDSVSGQLTGCGKRVGFEIYTLSRINVLRDAWKNIAKAISDLELTPPESRFPRQSSYEQVRSKDWIFHEELGKFCEGSLTVSDDTYVSVEDPARKGCRLSVMIDSSNFEDVQVTIYQPFNLESGDVIQAGDLHLKQPIHPKSIVRESEPVPLEWVGQPFDKEVHGLVKRRTKASITRLTEVIA